LKTNLEEDEPGTSELHLILFGLLPPHIAPVEFCGNFEEANSFLDVGGSQEGFEVSSSDAVL